MHNGDDNRLTDVFITQAMKPALDTVEKHWRDNWRAGQAKKDESLCKGAVILVGNRKQDKFFSNGMFLVYPPGPCTDAVLGLDFPNVLPNPNFFPGKYTLVLTRP